METKNGFAYSYYPLHDYASRISPLFTLLELDYVPVQVLNDALSKCVCFFLGV